MKKQSLYILTGASKGLGEALKNHLVQLPNTMVIGVSRSPIKNERNFIPLQIDLANTDELISKIPEIFPSGDFDKVVLINNAGWIGEIAHNGNISPSSIKTIHSVNVIAPAILMNAFVQKYKGYRGDKIVVNVSSGAAVKIVDGWSGYSSSKAALNQMTMIAQHESDLKDLGFKMFALSPGIIDTPMQESIRAAAQNEFSGLSKFQSFKDNGELSTPDEVAKKVLFLINNPSNFDGVLQDVRKF